ncbi:glycosyltransferase [Oscillatoria sp. FACHB-1406]|uniref:glycosyltransferase n=1 Tax=Oscillatoria sp. FACHB-1406 TaxID=2692846 RepID=UPI001689D5C7|nr:glycosyltransferase [Oscillatoria sp. FACHB-1406]MBD2578750.1 glycosyltransferase [Oscillatoria sp. FACHB-1406]
MNCEARKYKVLLVAAKPMPYMTPVYRLLAQQPNLEILVAFCNLQGAQLGLDDEFGVQVEWDIPLLAGYPWVELANASPKPGLNRFWGLVNWELWDLMKRGNFDCAITYTGYVYASFWILAAATKLRGKRFIFSTDMSSIAPRDRASWKSRLKPKILPYLYRLGDRIVASNRLGKQVLESIGVEEDRVVLTPSCVDNDWWRSAAENIDPLAARQQWEIPPDASVVLFCAKFQPWKRPLDLLRAFARASVPNSYLLFAGDGPQRRELENEAEALGMRDRVKFLGFLNQSQLPAAYRAADLFVLPSEYEPFGMVVAEAMLCGCPAVVSDRVGARADLIIPDRTGFIYPCDDIEALANLLAKYLPQREKLREIGIAARDRMETWSPRENVAALVSAIVS